MATTSSFCEEQAGQYHHGNKICSHICGLLPKQLNLSSKSSTLKTCWTAHRVRFYNDAQIPYINIYLHRADDAARILTLFGMFQGFHVVSSVSQLTNIVILMYTKEAAHARNDYQNQEAGSRTPAQGICKIYDYFTKTFCERNFNMIFSHVARRHTCDHVLGTEWNECGSQCAVHSEYNKVSHQWIASRKYTSQIHCIIQDKVKSSQSGCGSKFQIRN